MAADMDGTLLDSQKRLSPRLFPLLRRLLARGVRFAVASGRQYYSLLQSFEPLKDDILFISENGAMVMEAGRCVYFMEVPVDAAAEVLRIARGLPGVMPVLCCEQGAYIEDDDPIFVRNVRPYYVRCTRVPDLLEVVGQGRVCKVAVFDTGGAERGAYPLLSRRFADRLDVCLSGQNWTDLMPKGVNKGVAVQAYQRRTGIGPEACMAFGDYLNDYEMLCACGESYAMANAHPKLKAVSRHLAASNDDDGVVRALCEAFGLSV